MDNDEYTDPLTAAKIAESQARTRRIAIEIAKSEGELVPAVTMQIAFAEFVRDVALFLDGLPDTLERQAYVDAATTDRVRKAVDEFRSGLYDKLREQLSRSQSE